MQLHQLVKLRHDWPIMRQKSDMPARLPTAPGLAVHACFTTRASVPQVTSHLMFGASPPSFSTSMFEPSSPMALTWLMASCGVGAVVFSLSAFCAAVNVRNPLADGDLGRRAADLCFRIHGGDLGVARLGFGRRQTFGVDRENGEVVDQPVNRAGHVFGLAVVVDRLGSE